MKNESKEILHDLRGCLRSVAILFVDNGLFLLCVFV